MESLRPGSAIRFSLDKVATIARKRFAKRILQPSTYIPIKFYNLPTYIPMPESVTTIIAYGDQSLPGQLHF